MVICARYGIEHNKRCRNEIAYYDGYNRLPPSQTQGDERAARHISTNITVHQNP